MTQRENERIRDRFDRFLALIQQLENAGIHYQVSSYLEDALSIVVRVPGQYWEIDFHQDGTVEIERFLSSGTIEDESALAELFAQFAEEETASQP